MFFFLLSLFAASFSAKASFIVEQYDDFWSSNLTQLSNYANANTASTTGGFEYIDFTDFNRNNDFAGFNLWPSDIADGNGYSGPNAAINETFFVRITGLFDIDGDGDYTIRTLNDDGIFVFVDGVLVINDPTLHPIRRFSADLSLTAGTHDIELFMFERGGAADLEVSIASNGGAFSLLNARVPEPSILALMGLGIIGLGFSRRRMRK